MSARRGIRKVLYMWPYVVLLLGIVGLARPVALDLYESWQAQQSIAVVEATYDAMEDETRNAIMEEARAYNAALATARPLDERVPYEKQLSYANVDMIAHLSIPKVSINLPIYHGTNENTLMTGVGHLEGSALPVGTVGGRCVLAGHSGMPNARMFDDIHLLEPGDRFVIWTLGEAFAYEVFDVEVVLPNATDRLIPVAGEDLVTLVTCTPYGTNTHRLLVTGRRCEYVEDEEVIPETEVYVNRRTVPLMIGLGATGLVFVSGIAFRVAGRRRRRKAERERTRQSQPRGTKGG